MGEWKFYAVVRSPLPSLGLVTFPYVRGIGGEDALFQRPGRAQAFLRGQAQVLMDIPFCRRLEVVRLMHGPFHHTVLS